MSSARVPLMRMVCFGLATKTIWPTGRQKKRDRDAAFYWRVVHDHRVRVSADGRSVDHFESHSKRVAARGLSPDGGGDSARKGPPSSRDAESRHALQPC